jgi:hypothetical protein
VKRGKEESKCITVSGSVSSTLSCNTRSLKKEEKNHQTSHPWECPNQSVR